MKHPVSYVLMLLFLVVVGLLAPAAGVAAAPTAGALPPAQTDEADPNACAPIDVVFLIDQSSSMSEGGNDPTEQRRYAVESAIDLMADIALDSCPGVIHRVGVISFGTTAEVDLPLSEIGPFNPAEPGAAYARRDELKASVRADDLGQTSPSAAFTEARRMLDEAAPLNDGEQARKRAVIFITDGIPCVDDDLGQCGPTYPSGQYMVRLQNAINDGFSFDPVALERERCLQALRDAQPDPETELPLEGRQACLTTHQAGPQAYANSTFIWVLLMRDAGRPYPASIYAIWENITHNYAGRLIDLSNNRQAIPTTFRGILEQLTGVRAERLECGNFAVNPYLKKAVFNFNKFEPSIKVTLSYVDVNGNEHTLVDNTHDGGFDVREHLVSGPNERYEIAYPYPGLWSISSEDCDNLDAFYQPIQAAAQSVVLPPVVAQYDLPPYYNPDAPLHLEFSFIDGDTRQVVPQAGHPQFALNVTAEVIAPDGASETYTLEKVPNEEVFRTTEPLPVNVAGNYTVKFRVTSAWHDGEPNTVSADYPAVFAGERVLLEQTAGFQVRPVIPFRVEVVTPANGETLTPIHVAPGPDNPPTVAPVPVRVKLINRDGTPFGDWAVALPRPDSTFLAQMDVDGELVSAPLRADPDAPGEFTGELPGTATAGEQQLVVQLSDLQDVTLLNEDYYPDNPRQTVTFTREDATWRFAILSPQDGETQRPIHDTPWQDGLHWPLRVQPVPVRVELVDAAGQPYADPAAVMSYAPRVISATLEVADQFSGVYLEPDPEEPGQYTGEIVSGGERGQQTVTVDVDYSFPDYDPASEPASATFTRADGLLTSAGTYYLLLALLLALLALRVWRYRAARNNPVRGQLVFSESGQPLATIALSNGKNERVVKKRELAAYPSLLLDSLRVRSTAKPRREGGGEADAFATAWDAGGVGGAPVNVEYRYNGGRRQSTPLSPNMPLPVGDSPIMMEYQPLERE